MNNPYKALDIDNDADADEIKKAFRKKSKETHPDAGGDKESFIAVQNAYDILSDELKRRHYDKEGVYKEENKTKAAISLMTGTFINVLGTVLDSIKGVDRTDIIKKTKRHLRDNKYQSTSTQAECKKRIAQLESALSRLSCSAEKDYFGLAISTGIIDTKVTLKKAEAQQEIAELALQMIDDYSYETEKGDTGWTPTGYGPKFSEQSLFEQITGI